MTEIYKCPIDGCGQIAEHEFYCTQHGCEDFLTMPVSVLIADTSDRQRIAELEQQLAAMTAERDELKDENERLKQCCTCVHWFDCDYECCYPDMKCGNNKSEKYNRGTSKRDSCKHWKAVKNV